MKNDLIKRIKKRKARIAVLGLGRVGLPTAAIFANAGFEVIGVDINPKVIATVSKGKIPYIEPNLSTILKNSIKKGKLKVTTDSIKATKDSDVVIVCVQTPLTKDKKPNLSYLKNACNAIARGLSGGKLVIIESTVPPKTTQNIIAPLLEDKSGLRCGIDFWLAYCPERIAPGKAIREFVENPRIVGGYDEGSATIAAELFGTVVKGEVLITDCLSAEVAKLAENTFRDVNIAFANELALICEHLGADVMEVIRLANTHPRVNIHKPGCGVGGPCLPKDPYMLLDGVEPLGFKSRVIVSSRELNDFMPEHTVELAEKALLKSGKNIEKSKIAILGAAYKEEVDDPNNSPTEGIVKRLMTLGAKIFVYDPYCKESFGAKKASSIPEAVKRADCLLITVNHKAFKKLELRKIKGLMSKDPLIVDSGRIIDPAKARKEGFKYYGTGYPF